MVAVRNNAVLVQDTLPVPCVLQKKTHTQSSPELLQIWLVTSSEFLWIVVVVLFVGRMPCPSCHPVSSVKELKDNSVPD